MAQFKVGNIWEKYKNKDSWLVITTNSYVKKDGRLAMGKGVAKEALDKQPLLDALLGGFIVKTCGHLGFYGIAVIAAYKIIALQTKYHFKDKSDLELIKRSIDLLTNYMKNFPDYKINMVFPGIGYGQLDTLTVYNECLKDLPANYIIHTNDYIHLNR